jgi:hypothetical protein
MGHPKITNHTAFAFAPMFLTDANGRPLFVPLLRATFVIAEDGRLRVAHRQPPPCLGGEPWGPPELSSLRLEPEAVAVKPASDVVLIGHAHAPQANAVETTVGLRVGPVRKAVRVVGDRQWVKRAGFTVMTSPQPLGRVPLRWERAFGGWDRSSPDPSEHRGELRNPVGMGFRTRWNDAEPQVALPNLEDPEDPIRSFGDRPRPAGFGFLGPQWQPRAAFAGTYDAGWFQNRMPLLPQDFDPRFFNAAPPDQIVAGHLQGVEEVTVVNASPRGTLHFALPGKGVRPRFEVTLRDGGAQALSPVLDTLIIDTDLHTVTLLWRASVPVRDVPHDVVACEVEWGRRVTGTETGTLGGSTAAKG